MKEPGEVARIRAACAIADDALADAAPALADGPTEREFALDARVRDAPRAARAATASTRSSRRARTARSRTPARPTAPIERDELVVIDFGCIVDGYCSDMTRTVSVGDPGPDARQRVGRRAREPAGRARRGRAPASSARRSTARAATSSTTPGWGDAFAHGTGHGVGLEIHEAPRVAATAGDTLEPGYVVTVEPGVYLPGVGGVRIEDTVVVTPDGADALTAFPKHLVI